MCGRTLFGYRHLRSVSIKIALSFHPSLPPQNSFINILHIDAFEDESPETTGGVVGRMAVDNLDTRQGSRD